MGEGHPGECCLMSDQKLPLLYVFVHSQRFRIHNLSELSGSIYTTTLSRTEVDSVLDLFNDGPADCVSTRVRLVSDGL